MVVAKTIARAGLNRDRKQSEKHGQTLLLRCGTDNNNDSCSRDEPLD